MGRRAGQRRACSPHSLALEPTTGAEHPQSSSLCVLLREERVFRISYSRVTFFLFE